MELLFENKKNVNEQAYDAIDRAIKIAKIGEKYSFSTTKLNQALNSNDRKFVIDTIILKWKQIKHFANSISFFTGITVNEVENGFYDDKDFDYLYNQLHMIKFEIGLKILIDEEKKELLMKTLKQLNLIDDKQAKQIKRMWS